MKLSGFLLKCVGIFMLFFLLLSQLTSAQTQEPQLVITWQTQNYQPPSYSGKNLPTINSPIIAAVELIDNDKLISLTKSKITWFLNNEVIFNDIGLKRIAFNMNGLPGDRILLEADVNYGKKSLIGAAIIPIVQPKAVIAAPHIFNREIKTGAHNFKVAPFFFNIKNIKELLFTWAVNEQQETSTKNSDILNLEINSENPNPVPINLTATIANLNNAIETARDEIRLMLIQ